MSFIGTLSPGELEQQHDPYLEKVAIHYKVPAAFSNAEFYDCVGVPQQEGDSDCGWWAVYNAIMFVITGGDEFTTVFTARQLVPNLRELFWELTTMEAESSNLPAISNDQPGLLRDLSISLSKLFNSGEILPHGDHKHLIGLQKQNP